MRAHDPGACLTAGVSNHSSRLYKKYYKPLLQQLLQTIITKLITSQALWLPPRFPILKRAKGSPSKFTNLPRRPLPNLPISPGGFLPNLPIYPRGHSQICQSPQVVFLPNLPIYPGGFSWIRQSPPRAPSQIRRSRRDLTSTSRRSEIWADCSVAQCESRSLDYRN